MNPNPSRTSTIMCADGVLADHTQYVADVARAHSGIVIAATAGAVVVGFESASAAVIAGVEMQQVIAATVRPGTASHRAGNRRCRVERRRVHRHAGRHRGRAECPRRARADPGEQRRALAGHRRVGQRLQVSRLARDGWNRRHSGDRSRWIGGQPHQTPTLGVQPSNRECRCRQASPHPLGSHWSVVTPSGACCRRRGNAPRPGPARWC